jgi:hypothetical protein
MVVVLAVLGVASLPFLAVMTGIKLVEWIEGIEWDDDYEGDEDW